MTEKNLLNNKSKNQYEFYVEGKLARIEYILTDMEIFLTHTEVDKELEGKGIGKIIIELALTEISDQNLKLIPLCPFVASFIRSNPKWKSLLKDGINI